MPTGQSPAHTGRKAAIRSVPELIEAGLARPHDAEALQQVASHYSMLIPSSFATLIQEPDDPIGRQVIPDEAELHTSPHERHDPIADEALSPVPGIVHRYGDRALLKPILVCPVYCRFCFRREQVGPDGGLLSDAALAAALDWLGSHRSIREVILTGGDPLLLSERRLAAILQALDAMAHVETIRIHSRVPTADPGRLTALLDVLQTAKPLWLVAHVNHASELTEASRLALLGASRKGVLLLGQSVLLRGVNDTVEALEGLLRGMLSARIKPYYLHQLDPAPGTARFHVPVAEGQALLRQLRGRVTGLAWPTYVLDIPGGFGKVPIGPDYIAGQMVSDPEGGSHLLAGPAR